MYNPISDAHLTATLFVALDIHEASVRIRTGPPKGSRDHDPDAPGTAGVVPFIPPADASPSPGVPSFPRFVTPHRYTLTLTWTGNLGQGTAGYRAYSRAHELSSPGRVAIPGSSDPAFRGDASCYNPEELLVGSLAACHMLWYLHLCADAGVVIETYRDAPEGIMEVDPGGGGRFVSVTLRPACTYHTPVDPARVRQLHEAAHERCFVANSMNFPVRVEPADG